MRIATWNINSVTTRLGRVLDWLETREPDVLCLQELKTTPDGFPSLPIAALGYEAAVLAQGRWNGVAILSRIGLDDVVLNLPHQPAYGNEGEIPIVEARAVGATVGATADNPGVRLWSLYIPNGRDPDHAHFQYKLEWLDVLRDTASSELASRGSAPFALLGDFNVAPTDKDVWDAAKFVGSTHVTPDERARYEALVAAGLVDVMPRPGKGDNPFTFWDYRGGALHKDEGMRIDLILGNPAFAGVVKDAWVDREARKGSAQSEGGAPSDHAPVVVDLDL
jgi:exodeoxyribonuclease-3